MASSLENLPVEVHLKIVRFVEIEDVLSLRRATKALREMTYNRSVWFELLSIHVIQAGLPTPGFANRDIYTLSSAELETATLRAIKCRRNWTSSSPKPATRVTFQAGTASPNAEPRYPSLFRAPAAYLIRIRNELYLLTLTFYTEDFRSEESSDEPDRNVYHKYLLQLWDFMPGLRNRELSPRCVAERICQNVRFMCVNSDPAHPASVSLMTEDHSGTMYKATMLTMDPACNTGPKDIMREYASFPSLRRGVSLQGSRLIMEDHAHAVHLANTSTGQADYVLQVPSSHANDPTMMEEDFLCRCIYTAGDFVLVFRALWIHIYALTPHSTEALRAPLSPLEPIIAFRWGRPIYSMNVIEHRISGHEYSIQEASSQVKPLCLLVRFESGYPWPVDVLHQYILAPNPAFDAEATRAALAIGEKPASLADLPYCRSSIPTFRGEPYLVSSIPSAVRIFSPMDMALGVHGTALWLDAQTDPSSIRQLGDRGQRIAGRVLTYQPRRSIDQVCPARLVGAQNHSEGCGCASADENVRTMTFHIQQERDEWTMIALDEEEGLVAMLGVDGMVTICSYV